MLLVPELGEAEALLLAGAAPFAAHRGYGRDFVFVGAVDGATWHTVPAAPAAAPAAASAGGGGGSSASSSSSTADASSSSSSSSSRDDGGAPPGGGATPASAAAPARAGAAYGGLAPGSSRDVYIAIDAINFRASQRLPHQLLQAPLHRELVKASAGFGAGRRAAWPSEAGAPLAPIATGHWGCGAYKGHRGLKLLVQWLAASAAGRALQYHFFREAGVQGEAERALAAVFGAGGGGGGCPAPPVVTVGHLYAALVAYSAEGGEGEDIVTRVAAAAVALAAAARE